MAFQTQQSQSGVGGGNAPSSSMAQNTAAAQHQEASAAAAASASSGLTYMSPYIRQDFLSQEAMIEIMPKFELGRIQFLNGKYGPFSPNYPVSVPLWLALFLRETNTCTIRPPRELTVDFLNKVLQFEGENDTSFHALPFHFFSIVRQILRYASHDIPDAAVVHRLVDELEQRRVSKITKNINVLQQAQVGLRPPAFQLALTASEWLVVKSTIQRVMNGAVDLEAKAAQRLHRAAGGGGTSSSSTTTTSRQQQDFYQSTTSGSSMFGGETNSSATPRRTNTSTAGSNMMMMSSSMTGGGGGTATDETSTNYYSGSSQEPGNASTSASTRTRRSLRG